MYFESFFLCIRTVFQCITGLLKSIIPLLRASLDKKGRDPEFFLNGIRQLGKLFDFDASEPYDYVGFGKILEKIDQQFNIDTQIREVSVYLFYHQ